VEPHTEPDDAERRASERWRAARDLSGLGELGALFVEGRLPAFPGWGAARTDEETDAIAPTLARLNRAGFLTLASQPGFEGLRAGRAARQRAFVAGFAGAALATRLLSIRARGLELALHGPGLHGPGLRGPAPLGPALHEPALHEPALHGPGLPGPALREPAPSGRAALAPFTGEPVTLEDGEPRVFTGHDAREEELALFAPLLHADALRALSEACYVATWDPVYGRQDALWPALLEACEARLG
jgi:hypothetical protein